MFYWYYNEPATEIDIVVGSFPKEESNDNPKEELVEIPKQSTIYWGSCKRNCQIQDTWNLMAHVVSFFNNRGYDSDEWWSAQHVFMFLSPTFDEKKESALKNSLLPLNTALASDKSRVLKACTELSNVERGKHFQPTSKFNSLPELFQVKEILVISWKDLCTMKPIEH